MTTRMRDSDTSRWIRDAGRLVGQRDALSGKVVVTAPRSGVFESGLRAAERTLREQRRSSRSPSETHERR